LVLKALMNLVSSLITGLIVVLTYQLKLRE